MDVRVGRFDLTGTAATTPELELTWLSGGVAYSLAGKAVSVWTGGTVDPDPTDLTGATEFAATIASNVATVTLSVPEGESVPLRLTLDGSVVGLGTLVPSTSGSLSPDLTVTVNVDPITVTVELVTTSNPLPTTINVKAYGAAGNGTTDDTTAIDAAWVAALAADTPLEFPPGTYLYSGTGLVATKNRWRIQGAGRQLTTINITSAVYFVTHSANAARNIGLTDITFGKGSGSGYKGVLLQSATTNATGSELQKVIARCNFTGYTECAINICAADSPYWMIEYNEFTANDDVATIGIALTGPPNQSSISHNVFNQNQVHVKLTRADDCTLQGNAFIFTDNSAVTATRVSLWVVPNQRTGAAVSRHDGMLVIGNKFGSEKNVATDYRVLFAPESGGTYSASSPWFTADGGTTVGSRLPLLSATAIPDTSATPAAGGAVQGVTFYGNKVSAAGTSPKAFIHSFTPNVYGLTVGALSVRGTQIPYVVEIDPSITAPTGDLSIYRNKSDEVAPVPSGTYAGSVVALCNVSGFVRTATLA